MKNKVLSILILLMFILSFTGCTRYASESPTPQTEAKQSTEFTMPTPTLVAIEVEAATRTPIPLVLKTATPTPGIEEILTATVGEGEAPVNPEGGEGQPTGEAPKAETTKLPASNITPAAGKLTPTKIGAKATSQPLYPTNAPLILISGDPTIAIVHIKYADSITLDISRLPVSTQFKLRMGSPASYGGDGATAETIKSDDKGHVTGTYKIPADFAYFGQIGVRVEYPDGNYVAFYFNNNDY